MEDALQLTALGAICNLLREEDVESPGQESFTLPSSNPSTSAKYVRGAADPLTPIKAGKALPTREGIASGGEFDALWRNESIQQAAQRRQRAAAAAQPLSGPTQLSLSDLNNIMGEDEDKGVSISDLAGALPVQRYSSTASTIGGQGQSQYEGEDPVSEHGVGSLSDGSSLHENLSSLKFSLAASMNSISAVGNTLRRLTVAGDVPREYRHMAQWVGDRVMSGLHAV